jgi:hypothetical protein
MEVQCRYDAQGVEHTCSTACSASMYLQAVAIFCGLHWPMPGASQQWYRNDSCKVLPGILTVLPTPLHPPMMTTSSLGTRSGYLQWAGRRGSFWPARLSHPVSERLCRVPCLCINSSSCAKQKATASAACSAEQPAVFRESCTYSVSSSAALVRHPVQISTARPDSSSALTRALAMTTAAGPAMGWRLLRGSKGPPLRRWGAIDNRCRCVSYLTGTEAAVACIPYV